jgi:hypothetical protein
MKCYKEAYTFREASVDDEIQQPDLAIDVVSIPGHRKNGLRILGP